MNTTEIAKEQELQDIKKKSISGAVSYFARTIILQGIGFASVFVLSYYFSPEDFGVYGFVIQIIGLLTFFSDVGLAAALIQKKEEPSITDYRTAFTIQQILSWFIVGILAILLMTGLVQEKTGMAGVWILIALGLSFPLATLKTIPSVILERKLDFSKLVVPQLFEQFAFHTILIVLAIQGKGAVAYAYAIIFRSIIGVVVMAYLQRWNVGFSLNTRSFKSLVGYGVKFQLNDFLARIKDQLFYLFLGFVLPLREFGYIQWAKNWSMYPYNLTVQNVMAITFPAFSRLQNHPQALQKAIEKSLFFITAVIFPILIGMSVFILPFITIVSKWQKWEPAVLSLIFFSLSIGWSAISTPLTNTLSAVGQINKTLKLMVLWTALTWVLTPIGMYLFGMNGVAAMALVISFTSIIPVMMVKKIVPINFVDQVYRQTIAAVLMGVVGFLGFSLWSQGVSQLLLGMFVSIAVYGSAFMLLGKNKIILEIRSLR